MDNYDLILIPSFETKEMSGKSQRKLRAKSSQDVADLCPFPVPAIPDLESVAVGKAGFGGERSLHQQDL